MSGTLAMTSASTPKANESSDYARFCQLLEQRSGIVLGEGKQYLVTSRLTALMRDNNMESLGQLVDKLQGGFSSTLLQSVIDAMTTNETMWFRDNYPFDVLEKQIFPEAGGMAPLSIWCAACSTGQEPYSVAMVADEYRQKNRMKPFAGVRILATDIASSVLASAKEGVYDSLAMARGLSEVRKKSYFEPVENGRLRVRQAIRQQVMFQSLNLLNMPYSVGPFDVIFCRNVLIYFDPQVKNQVLNALGDRLRKGGYLFVGGSESLGDAGSRFEMIRCSPGIVYRRK